MNVKDLINFENDIAETFNEGKIKAPIHLYSDNEKFLIKFFKKVKKDDWVFCSWRSHYQCLLKGVPKEGTILGESLGINKWSPYFMEQFYKLFSIHKHKYRTNLHWEMFLGDLLAFSNEDNMKFLGIEGMSWVNINYREDILLKYYYYVYIFFYYIISNLIPRYYGICTCIINKQL